jgi:hypothetical protein
MKSERELMGIIGFVTKKMMNEWVGFGEILEKTLGLSLIRARPLGSCVTVLETSAGILHRSMIIGNLCAVQEKRREKERICLK